MASKKIGTYLKATEIKVETQGKTKRYLIENADHDIPIGIVKWYPSWRQYCFFPYQDVILSAGCLEDIRKFLLDMNADHAEEMKKRREN